MGLVFRFTLSHTSGSQVISEPDGWQNIKIRLERDAEYHSLIEFVDVAFIFYGNNGEHNGGKDFLVNIIRNVGINETISFLSEVSEDDGDTYDEISTFLLDLQSYKILDDRKLQIGLLRDDLWSKFTNRESTPVDIQSTTDLDGGAVDPAEPILVNLTGQKIEQRFKGNYKIGNIIRDPGSDFENYYFPWDVDDVELDEIEKKYNLPVFGNTVKPAWIFEPEFAGEHVFDIRIELSKILLLPLGAYDADNMDTGGDRYVRWYFQKNDDTPIEFNITDYGSGVESTVYDYSDTLDLVKGDVIYIYGFFAFPLPALESMLIWGINNNGVSVDPGGAQFNLGPAPSAAPDPSYLHITAQTEFDDTQIESFLLHDVADAILKRISGGTGIYSEYLGSTYTTALQYAADGCASNYTLQKGLHVRGYSLDDKKYFQSFKEWWDGVNPIHNLGLSYEIINGDAENGDLVIRIEDKAYFFDTDPSILLNYVNNIEETIDKNLIFKSVKVGYNKWQSEDIRGLDDPQTKKTYATLFKVIGRELLLYSEFIAASLAFEFTRRKTIEKSADYKFDNDTFILAINPTPTGSPDSYNPELDENFVSVSNILNSDTRYNLFLTPLRNFTRWANYVNGCLQSYLDSAYKFVSGEGNYDFSSDYDCTTGIKKDCQGTLCDDLAENQDIGLSSYAGELGYLFTPTTYEFDHPLSWEDYKTIRDNRTKAIGVSTSDANHEICFIKRLEYDINKSKAKFVVWKR